jgi:hypothetical protein
MSDLTAVERDPGVSSVVKREMRVELATRGDYVVLLSDLELLVAQARAAGAPESAHAYISGRSLHLLWSTDV